MEGRAPDPLALQLLRLEAVVIAQRKLLMQLIGQTGAAAGMRDYLAERDQFQGHEEDPGVLPSAEYALEAAVAEEFRRLAREIEALVAAPGPVAAG